MEYPVILRGVCSIAPDFIPFVEWLGASSATCNKDQERRSLPAGDKHRALARVWESLCIGSHWYQFELTGGILRFGIEKLASAHAVAVSARGGGAPLVDAYLKMMRDLMAPVSDAIVSCEIVTRSARHGRCVTVYCDDELRSGWWLPFDDDPPASLGTGCMELETETVDGADDDRSRSSQEEGRASAQRQREYIELTARVARLEAMVRELCSHLADKTPSDSSSVSNEEPAHHDEDEK